MVNYFYINDFTNHNQAWELLQKVDGFLKQHWIFFESLKKCKGNII